MSKAFLSYNQKDERFVRELYSRLSRDGVDCFFDKESIDWGANWVVELAKGLNECNYIVPILTPDFCHSEWTQLEQTAFMAGNPEVWNKKIRPLLIKDCKCDMPIFLKPIQAIDVSSAKKFEMNYPSICRQLGGVYKEKKESFARTQLVHDDGGAKIHMKTMINNSIDYHYGENTHPRKKKLEHKMEKTGVLVMVDVVNYTPQSRELGAENTANFNDVFFDHIKVSANMRDGNFIKSVGDAAITFFTDTSAFIDFSSKLRHQSFTGALDKFGFLCKVRIVAHYGKFGITFDEKNNEMVDVYGDESIILFRMEKIAKENFVVITEFLRHMCKQEFLSKGITVKELDETLFKGFIEPIRIFQMNFPDPGEEHPKEDILALRLNELEYKCSVIPVFGDIYPAMSMEKNFINLEIAPNQNDSNSRDLNDPSVGRSPIDVRLPDPDQTEGFNAAKLYNDERMGFIFGLPGSGKTTILNYFAFRDFQSNKNNDNNREQIVLLVSCRVLKPYREWFTVYFGDKSDNSANKLRTFDMVLPYFLYGYLYPNELKPRDVSLERAGRVVINAFVQGQLTLLVDALDEAPTRVIKEDIIMLVKELMNSHYFLEKKGNRIFVTGRLTEMERVGVGSPKYPTKSTFIVCSLEMEQLKSLAQYFYRDSRERFKEFRDMLWREELVAKVGGTPLTALLIIVYFDSFHTFDTRFNMYHIIVSFILIRAWEFIKTGTFSRDLRTLFKELKSGELWGEDANYETRIIYDGLSALTWGLREKQWTIREDNLLFVFSKLAAQKFSLLESQTIANKWLNRLKEDHLLLPAGDSEYVFIHNSVMEFLASRFMVESTVDSKFTTEAFPYIKSVGTAVQEESIDFFHTDSFPLAVGSSLKTGASLLRLLKHRVAREPAGNIRNSLYLTGIKALVEWETLVERNNRRGNDVDFIRQHRENEIQEYWDGVEWIYQYIKTILEGEDKKALIKIIEYYHNMSHLPCTTLLVEYLSPDVFLTGESELVELRRQLLYFLIDRDEAEKWLNTAEEKQWQLINIAHLSQLDSETYHPEDKNFHYYCNYTGPTLCGLLGSPNFRHSFFVNCIAVSPSGTVVASGDENKNIKLWDIATGKELMTIKGHTGGVRSLKFSPEGDRIASGADDKTIKLWGYPSGKMLKTLVGHMNRVNCICFSPDGKTLLSGSRDGSLKWWDLETDNFPKTLTGHKRSINAVDFSPNGRFALSSADDKTLKLWDLISGKEVKILKGHTDFVKNAVFSRDGRIIISVSWDKNIKWWKVQSEKAYRTIKAHRAPITCMDFSNDGKTIATGSWDKTIKLRDFKSGKVTGVLVGHKDQVRSVAFCPDNNSIISAAREFTLRHWDPVSEKEIKSFRGHLLSVSSVDFSPNGKTLLSASWDSTLKLWDLESGREIQTFNGHQDQVHTVRFSTNGKTAVSGSFDSTLKWWDIESGKLIQTYKGHKYGINSVCFCKQGKSVISGSFDHTLKLWDLESGKNLKTFQGHKGFVWSLAINQNERHVVSASDDGTIKLWSIESGLLLKTFPSHSNHVYCVNFSPNGQYIVSGGDDGNLNLWDVSSSELRKTFIGHKGPVLSVTFSKNGKYVLSCSLDYSLRIWDTATGNCIATISLFWLPGEIMSSPTTNGFYACANRNGTIALFDFKKIFE